MLSYQHAYHAGNLADVHKHTVLLAALRICLKAWPRLRYVESHAGRGRYDLQGFEANKTGEWRQGIARLAAAGDVTGPLNHYRKFVLEFSKAKTLEALRWYPGSPAIARRVLRRTDVARLHDLHPQEFSALSDGLDQDDRFDVHCSDGLVGVQTLEAEPEMATFVLIDPSYENQGEFDAVLDATSQLKNVAVCLVWYPQLSDGRHQDLANWLHAAGTLSTFPFQRLDKNAVAGRKMYASSMGLLVNGDASAAMAKTLRRQLKIIDKSLESWFTPYFDE